MVHMLDIRLQTSYHRVRHKSREADCVLDPTQTERWSRSGSLNSGGGGDKGCCPFPRTPFSASGILPSLRSGQVSLDEAEHFLHNRDASVATLRWCSGSSRDAVRLPLRE